MRRSVGADGGAYFEHAIQFLNEVLGTNAEFVSALYDPRIHSAPSCPCAVASETSMTRFAVDLDGTLAMAVEATLDDLNAEWGTH